MTPEEDYQERVRILKALDVDAFIAKMPPADLQALYERPAYLHRAIVLGTMHKVRYEQPEATEAERAESRRWLEAHGLKRLGGKDFPPKNLT